MKFSFNKERGTVLVNTLIITGLVTVGVAALLMVVQRQNYFTARSATWCSEIPIAEAGIEEALAHLNSRPPRIDTNGWTKVGSNYIKNRLVGTNADYFYAAISTSRPPTIVSVGYGRIPLKTNFTQRTVMVMTSERAGIYGIVASGKIQIGYADSYNSTDPAYSTGGRYDPNKRGDGAGVATLSSANPAIQAGSIYGSAATGPGGVVVGNVGDGAFLATSSGIQPGHSRDDYNLALPTVSLPTNAMWATPNYVGGVYLIFGGDYKIDAAFVTKIKVFGKARVWITGEIKMTGGDEITILSGASLDLYMSKDATFGGNGIVNGTGFAANCRLFALPTCKDMKFAGSTALTAQIIAPYTDVSLGGTPDIYGSIAAKTIKTNGDAGIHYDEALGTTTGPKYSIVSWEEL